MVSVLYLLILTEDVVEGTYHPGRLKLLKYRMATRVILGWRHAIYESDNAKFGANAMSSVTRQPH